MRQKTVTSSVTSSVTDRSATAGARLRELPPNRSIVLEKVPQGGSLEGRRLPGGAVQFYWRHTQNGKTERIAIGPYDSTSPPKSLRASSKGYSVAAAMEAARELAKENLETPGGLRAKRAREEEAKLKELEVKKLRASFTLAALGETYVDWLTQQGKVSSKDARNIFGNHLTSANPELANKAAAEVEKRDVVLLMRKLTEAGKLTTARKLRSYLRAAFACAVRSDADATLPSAFIGFGVSTNPVEATAAIAGRSSKKPLTLEELRRYWSALKNEPGVIGAALRLHLLSGGQRTAQLVRLRAEQIGGKSFQLLDAKGKRSAPRVHLLPITAEIAGEFQTLPKSGYILSTDGGTTPMHPTSLSAWAAAVAKRAKIREFQLKRVRSGVETSLAEAGVSLHLRGLLQSHGIGGVQERHYDAHTYLPEKHHVLETLYALISSERRGNIAQLRPGVRSAAGGG